MQGLLHQFAPLHQVANACMCAYPGFEVAQLGIFASLFTLAATAEHILGLKGQVFCMFYKCQYYLCYFPCS